MYFIIWFEYFIMFVVGKFLFILFSVVTSVYFKFFYCYLLFLCGLLCNGSEKLPVLLLLFLKMAFKLKHVEL